MVILLRNSNITKSRKFGVFESKIEVGDFYRKEMAVKYKKN